MSKEETRDPETLKNTRWAGLLDQIRQLPTDAWDGDVVEEFIGQVRLVAEQRRQERETIRSELRRAIDQLREGHESDLAFFNIDHETLSNWRSTRCPIDQIAERTETVRDLVAQLGIFHALRHQLPQNIQQSRQLRVKQEAAENRISALLDQLDGEVSRPIDENYQIVGAITGEDDEPPPKPPDPQPSGHLADPSHSDEEKIPKPVTTLSEEESQPDLRHPRGQIEQESVPLSEVPRQTSVHVNRVESELTVESSPHLRFSNDVAILLQTEESEENWISLGWSLLAEGDWAGAHWLARSLKSAGCDVPVAPQLLAVLQGSRWLQDDTDPVVFDIQRIISTCVPQNTTAERLIGLAGALRPSLIAPHTGLVDWLPERDENNPALATLARAVRSFAVVGHPLRPEDLQQVEGMASQEKVITDTITCASHFLESNQSRMLKIRRATNILYYLVGRDGELRSLLTPVIENQPNQVSQVEQQLNELSGRQHIIEFINHIDRGQTRRPRPIAGIPREQLVRSIQEAVGLASRWCSLIRRHKKATNLSGQWWSDQVNSLRRRIEDTLPGVNAELSRMQQQDRPEDEVSLSRVLQRAISQVTGFLGLEDGHDLDDIEVLTKGERISLQDALHRRLLWMPEISLDNDGRPEDDDTSETENALNIAKALRQSLVEKRSLHTALTLRIDSQDFRFTDILLDAFEDSEDRQSLEEKHDDSLKGSRAALRDRVEKVQGSIEQAMVDGLLAEEDRTSYSADLESTNLLDPLYFSPLFSRMDCIENRLNHKREERLNDLTEQWKEMRRELRLRIQPEQLVAVGKFIQRAFDQRDTRVVEESLARLREVVHGNREWKTEWFSPHKKSDVFTEFLEESQGTESGLQHLRNVRQLAKFVEQGQTWEGFSYDTLPTKRREEAVRAFKSWHRLIRLREQHFENCRRIRILMEYLGFHLPSGESAVSVKEYGQDWLHCEIAASASDLARPIPQFGSQTNGKYNVVCLWERPGAGAIGARLRDLKLDTGTVIVFFLGPLSDRRRRNIAIQARERELALVVLDEILLVFLARCDDTRLPTFLRCSLPYAALNPYTPFRAGNVPPEMYYGRAKMVRQLQTGDNCIVFGGRQLGKSALLRQVEREFHQPERDQFAWVEDIKLVGDPNTGEQPDQLWIRLRDTFKEHNLIRQSIVARTPSKIYEHIRGAMDRSPQRRVLVLFDEADHFLDADAPSFRVVNRLRTLMQDTQLRFKVVFAGLHSVQRFNDIPNQPLAHFGQNLLVGPLKPGPALRLVQEPLETLGYRFVDDTTVFKVLSYTNYHPGLIQYFCYELLRRLQSKRNSSGPPYDVRTQDVEAVYRLRQTREIIRERLDWTLALDPRYQCIAWAMIYEQKETRDSYIRTFGVTKILELANDSWPQGFTNVDIERLRGLLEEMVGLGILVSNFENQYLLRSPNLVRLMGTEENIEFRLLELSEKSPPTQSEPGSQHKLIGDDLYSPFTLVQEDRLKKLQKPGMSRVCLVFGSESLGLNALARTFEDINCVPIPEEKLVQDSNKPLCDWLNYYSKTGQKGSDQLFFYGRLAGAGSQMAHRVWELLDMFNYFSKRRRPMNVVFVLNPVSSWSWFRLIPTRRTDLEDRAGRLIALRRWDELGIKQRLEQARMMDSSDVCQEVLESTGGWPFLLNDLFSRCGGTDDPRPFAANLSEEITRSESELGSALLRQTGLNHTKKPFRILRAIVEFGPVRDAELDTLADLVEDGSLSPADCKPAVEFLYRMGCLEKLDGMYSVESVLARIIGHL